MTDVRKQKLTTGLPETGLRPSFADYADAYLAFHKAATESGKKPGTVAREGHSLVHWKKASGAVRLDKITGAIMTAFVKRRLAAGVRPRTVNIDVMALRGVLKAAKEAGLIQRLPTEGIKPQGEARDSLIVVSRRVPRAMRSRREMREERNGACGLPAAASL